MTPDPGGLASAGPAASSRPRAVARVELLTAAAAPVGGALLIARPDGSLRHADQAVLLGSPFTDSRAPGLVLAGLVGGGWLATGAWQWRGARSARQLSMVAGIGLVLFEAAELAWIRFQPLQAVVASVGVLVVALAARSR